MLEFGGRSPATFARKMSSRRSVGSGRRKMPRWDGACPMHRRSILPSTLNPAARTGSVSHALTCPHAIRYVRYAMRDVMLHACLVQPDHRRLKTDV